MWHVWGDIIGAYTVLVGRPDGKRPPGRPRRRLEDNINKRGHVCTLDLGVFVEPLLPCKSFTYYIF